MSKIKVTDINSTGATASQVPVADGSGGVSWTDQSGGGGGGAVLRIACGNASNTGVPYLAIKGGSA